MPPLCRPDRPSPPTDSTNRPQSPPGKHRPFLPFSLNQTKRYGILGTIMNDSSSTADIDIEHIAELAHFKLSPDELESLKKDLDSTIRYVQKLFELDVSNVEPTKFGQPVSNVLREDVVEPSLDHDTIIANAPDASDREFRMPKIVE